jgi:quinol monooxygenase YgiN
MALGITLTRNFSPTSDRPWGGSSFLNGQDSSIKFFKFGSLTFCSNSFKNNVIIVCTCQLRNCIIMVSVDLKGWMSMCKFGLYGKLIAQEGQRDALVQILLEAAESMHSVEGCEMYAVNISESEPDSVWVVEIWRDEAAHAASLTLESTKTLIQRGKPLIAGMDGVRLQVVGGKGV